MESLKEAKKLIELINYQEGSVVSRALIDKTVGTITVFAFSQDQGLSEHKAPYDALVNVLEGEAEIKIDGQAHSVKAGEAIILPANIPHALRALTPFKMLLVMIKK